MDSYIQYSDKIIEITDREMSYRDLLIVYQQALQIKGVLDEFEKITDGISRLAGAAYGIINEYNYLTADVGRLSMMLEKLVPTRDYIIGLTLSSFNSKRNINKDFFNIDDIIKVAQKFARIVNLIDKAHENRADMIELAIKYSDESPNWQKDDCVGYMDELAYSHLDSDTLIEKTYRFTGFNYGVSKKHLNSTDGDKWPIIKQLFPENYI